MRLDVREALLEQGAAAAREHPAQVERGLRHGARRFWRRLLLVNIAAAIGAVVLFLVLGTGSGQVELPPLAPKLTTITITPDPVTLPPLGSRPVVALGSYDDGSHPKAPLDNVHWKSRQPRFAKIIDGQVIALRPGVATIVASRDGITGEATVRVRQAKQKPKVLRIAITGSPVATPRTTVQLYAIAVYNQGTPTRDVSRKVFWRSSVPTVATVDPRGLVRTHARGAVRIMATLADRKPALSDSFKMTVRRAARPSPNSSQFKGLSIQPSVARVAVDERVPLTAVRTARNGTPTPVADVTWTSSNPSVATVNGSGVVLGKGPGPVTLTATSNRSQATGELQVQVVVLESLTLTAESSAQQVSIGDKVQLAAHAHFDDGTESPVTNFAAWQSSDPDVATVSEEGLVSCVGGGAADISASWLGTSSPALTVSCAPDPPPTPSASTQTPAS